MRTRVETNQPAVMSATAFSRVNIHVGEGDRRLVEVAVLVLAGIAAAIEPSHALVAIGRPQRIHEDYALLQRRLRPRHIPLRDTRLAIASSDAVKVAEALATLRDGNIV